MYDTLDLATTKMFSFISNELFKVTGEHPEVLPISCDTSLIKCQTGFALPIAIVAKCEEILFLAQKKNDLVKTSGEKKFSP